MKMILPIPSRLLFVISLLLVAIAVVGRIDASTLMADPDAQPTVWGDVTCDNMIDVGDVVDLMRRSSKLEMTPGCATTGPLVLRLDPIVGAARPGDTVTFSIFSDVHQFGIGVSYGEFHVVYDPRVLAPVACTSIGGGCNPAFAVNDIKWGIVSFSNTGSTGTTKLGTIQFTVIGTPGQNSDLSLQQVSLGDQYGHLINAVSSDATLSVLPLDATPPPTLSPSPTPTSYWQPADINCDSAVTVSDALLVLEYVALGGVKTAVSGSCPKIGS